MQDEMTRKGVILWSSALTVFLLVAGAVGLSDGTRDSDPEIKAPSTVELQEPEPTVTHPTPTKSESPIALQPSVTNISPAALPSAFVAPQTPTTAHQRPAVGPTAPALEQPEGSKLLEPLEGLVGPLIVHPIKPMVPSILK